MHKNERKREIISILKNNDGFVSVKELCSTLFASESSIRRDLTTLENRGIIKRTYGGAELLTNFSNVVTFEKRAHHNTDAKKIIAKKAANLISDGNVIFLDQSSTSYYLANEIINRPSLTVVTNNIEILGLLSTSKIKTFSSGGYLSTENRSCLVGTDAMQIFDNIYADMVFFSTKSISDDGIISDCAREEVLVRDAMLKNSAKKIFLCDSEKFTTHSPYKQCTLRDIDILICENNSSARFSGRFENLEIL